LAVRARAPASAANLGPGFDVLALALSLYVEVEVSPGERLQVASSGHGADLPADARHLAVRVASEVAGHDRLSIKVHSDIPVGRGLGSSAALAVAAAAAAGAGDPMAHGVAVDGHPENAAASTLGGLVTASTVRGRAVARRLPLDPELRFVALVPDRVLPTAESRSVLPRQVPHADAAFNLGRMGLLLAGLADHQFLVPEAFEDRLHQDRRTRFFPEAPELLGDLLAAGALGCCWSGAGPTLLAACKRAESAKLAAAARRSMDARGVPGEVLQLEAAWGGVHLNPPRGH
jgi:homoserine kinase